MKKILFSLFLLSMLAVSGCAPKTLDEAIQQQWKSPIKVIFIDPSERGVIFQDQDQYVFNTFQKTNEGYVYSKEGEDGFRFTGGTPPLLVRTIYRSGIGDIIWGAVKTDDPLKKISLQFIAKNNPQQTVSMSLPISNQAFIGYPSPQFYSSETEVAQKWNYVVDIYDKKGSLVLHRVYQ